MTEIIKEPPMEIDGRVMTPQEFVEYVEGLDFSPRPTRIFLHHTWKPTQDDWRGRDSLMATKAYYEKQIWQDSDGQLHEGWTAGPHLFVADDGIWLFSDLRYDGVGVYGHNYRSRHVEMVGNYDAQLPSGATLENTVAVLGILHERLGLDIENLNFHRDFSTKSCPGWAVRKEWIIPKVANWIEAYRRQKEEEMSGLRRSLVKMIQTILLPTNPETALVKEAGKRGLLGALTHEIPMEIEDKGYIVQLFAEALIVPVNEWGKAQSLKEYESENSQPPADRPPLPEELDRPASPEDPFLFDGDVR
ncbi:MAG: peptidoglycan recognition family protein [Chloroflexota bacterium]|nr:peptidoglycan recognition family protein [Chloroflexota bacterium]